MFTMAHFPWNSMVGNIIHFNIYEAMRFPCDVSSLCGIDIIEPISQELFELTHFDPLDTILSRSLNEARVTKLMMSLRSLYRHLTKSYFLLFCRHRN